MINMKSRKKQLAMGFWCAPVFSLFIAMGWLGISHFWLPAPVVLGPSGTAEFYTQTYQSGMLLGNSILIVVCAFLVPRSVQIGITFVESEGPLPPWLISTAAGGIMITMIFFLNTAFWLGTTYRIKPDPEVVVAINDIAWFGFLLGWVFLSLQMIAAATVTLSDPRPVPMVPHLISKVSIVAAVLLVLAVGPAFFLRSPLAYHCVLGFYIPMTIWGLWLLVHSWYMRREFICRAGSVAV